MLRTHIPFNSVPLQNSLGCDGNTPSFRLQKLHFARSLDARSVPAGDYCTQPSSVHSSLRRVGKNAPDEDPFLLQEAIRFVIFEAVVDEKHGGGEIFSLVDFATQFPGLTKDGPILAEELRQLIIEDANHFVKTQLLR